MITNLEKFGLSEKEAKVYLAALELGPQAVQKIAKKAGVNRATTYVVLENLMKLGIVSTFEKGKKTFFSAESPRYLDKLITKEEENLRLKRAEFNQILPELEAYYQKTGGKPVVRYFEGKESLFICRNELYEVTKKGDTIYTFTNLDNVYSSRRPNVKVEVDERILNGVNLKQIYNSSQGAIRKNTDKEALRESRFVPNNKFPMDISLNIIPNKKVRIAIYKDENIAISIDHPIIANSLKAIFDLAWESASKYNEIAKKSSPKKKAVK